MSRTVHVKTVRSRRRPKGDERDFSGARGQALFREMNEEIRRVAEGFDVDDRLELVCECEHDDCFARLTLTPVEYEAIRRFPTRFLTRADHVGADERVVVHTGRYVVVEKIGAGAEHAILHDPRKHATRKETA